MKDSVTRADMLVLIGLILLNCSNNTMGTISGVALLLTGAILVVIK